MKSFSYMTILASMITAGCCCFMDDGMKPPPDASCDPHLIDKLGMDAFLDKKSREMWDCGYNTDGLGNKQADACARKKGWYRTKPDPFPENKQYETSCPAKEQRHKR